MGPERLIVAARVDFSEDMSADQAEELADDIDKRLADRLPLIPHVFLDPTARSLTPAHGTRQAR
jgi:divalent metal cation (Fe/Co/Zn/Cd) transporter